MKLIARLGPRRVRSRCLPATSAPFLLSRRCAVRSLLSSRKAAETSAIIRGRARTGGVEWGGDKKAARPREGGALSLRGG